MFEDHIYSNGRCHLFALVAAEILDCQVSVLWDLEAWDEDMVVIPVPCLVHAFIVTDDGVNFDVTGYEASLNDFECNEPEYEMYSVSDFKNIIHDRSWPDFEVGEKDYLLSLVTQILEDAPRHTTSISMDF